MTTPTDRIPLRTELSTAGQLAQAQGRIRALEALRDRLTATVAGADTERDQARTDLGQALGQLTDAWAALNAAGYAHPVATVADLIRQCAADRDHACAERAEALEARDVARHLVELRTAALSQCAGERDDARRIADSLRQDLGDAGDLIAVVREASELIDRALAAHDTGTRLHDPNCHADQRSHWTDCECWCHGEPDDDVTAERDDCERLADAMERAESVLIDCDDDIWRPVEGGRWKARGHDPMTRDAIERWLGPTRAVLLVDIEQDEDDETEVAPSPGSGPTRAQDAIEGLLANVGRSLASAIDDDERAEAIGMLLDGWYAAWPDSAVTDPHEPLAGELVRLLCTPGIRPADWEQQAIAAVEEALNEARGHRPEFADPAHARQLAVTAVRAIIDAGLVGPGGRCPRCGSTYPRTIGLGEDARCWTCSTEDQTGGLDEPANTTREG